MFNLGWLEVSLILLALILVFGPKKLPELGGSIGKTLRGFKDELQQTNQLEEEDEEGDRKN
ncbi:MAG: twin-arginine translocase TatA/TatE family subunit [Aphanocapsa sp. GSE-SYN-MK-11-07L]|jgi:sec-independent protein translocase protein TatA|nr:twin-arginine translocase TatA/TatE family subunit [Aphanocapsa sp. GSE-SYN-MK-11-07L]